MVAELECLFQVMLGANVAKVAKGAKVVKV